jgi:uncharacterized Fe-S radical SAM superfamily protein PflX
MQYISLLHKHIKLILRFLFLCLHLEMQVFKILKWIVKKEDVKLMAGLNWLSIMFSDQLLWGADSVSYLVKTLLS